MGMHKSGGTKTRGRTKGQVASTSAPPVTKGNRRRGDSTDASRPIGRGGGKRRGDRVDTNRQFTGSRERTPNFSDPAGSGRQQIQAGGKARKGGGKKQKGTYDRA